jgi:hypothetical protein
MALAVFPLWRERPTGYEGKAGHPGGIRFQQHLHVAPPVFTHAAEFRSERVQMTQAWSDYLDGLRAGGTVVPFARHAAS